MTINLQTSTARARLAPRGKPYKVSLDRGLTLGYRRARNGIGSWVVIGCDGNGGQWTDTFARADDGEAADGVGVLTYAQATRKAAELANGRDSARKFKTRPVTVDEALANYETELRARGGNPYNATTARHHLAKSDFLGENLAAVTVKQLADWRRGLLTAGMKASSLNRLLKSVHACFNLAAKHDERVALNASAWKRGLEFIHGANEARNAVLSLPQVRALVAAAYALEEAFGVYIQAHAELGARSDQIARIRVRDLLGDRIMVPNSGKGRSNHKNRSGQTPRALTDSLAARFAALAKDRLADALLLTQPNGRGWTDTDRADRLFAKARENAAIPAIDGESVTLIAFRHSNIVRLLRANVPMKAVAQMHNTSARMIETNYAKFLPHDDLDRANLVDTAPGFNIVPLVA